MNSPVLQIALHEFTLNRRNKWIVSFAGLFMLLTLLISYFGMVTSGYAGFQDFTRTAASLINLSGFILPLFALLLGVFSFISNRDYIELLVTQPVSRAKVLLGKYIGLALTVVASTLIGFGLPGVVMALVIGTEGALLYALVVVFALLLCIVFVGLALLITLATQRRQIALGVSVGVWLFFELFYGVMVLGSTLYFSHNTLKSMLILLLAGNPIDIVRVLSLLAVGGPHFFGAAGATLLKLTGSAGVALLTGVGALAVWIILPLLVALKVFRRQNL